MEQVLDIAGQTSLDQNQHVGTPIESKLFIKVNEDASNVDFTFFVPTNCSYDHAKKGALATYEHIVRLENEAIRLQLEANKKEESTCVEVAEEVTASVVGA